jgi:UDP-GlcNAc:undecaprenyl-phosphate/decaprenyl-phosphate GlcNAc-1-phosphate transferase
MSLFLDYFSLQEIKISQCICSFLIALGISYWAIPIIINVSGLLNLNRKPHFRGSHQTATPEFGGIAIFVSVLIASFLWRNSSEIADSYLTQLSVVSLTILFFLGLKDDIFMIDSTKKLLLQIVAVIIFITLGDVRIDSFFGIFGINHLSNWVSIPFTIFVFIALINALNLIDGVDGLAGGIGLIVSSIFGIWFCFHHFYVMAVMAFALSGSLLGFLRYNFSNTQKIFMGDTGSLLIGFLLTFFTVKYLNINVENSHFVGSTHAPVLVVSILIVPIFDTLRMFIIRLIQKKSPFRADRNHLHHILLDTGFSHTQTSVYLWICTILSLGLNILSMIYWQNNTQSGWLLVGLFLAYLLMANLLKMNIKRKTESLSWSQFLFTPDFASLFLKSF